MYHLAPDNSLLKMLSICFVGKLRHYIFYCCIEIFVHSILNCQKRLPFCRLIGNLHYHQTLQVMESLRAAEKQRPVSRTAPRHTLVVQHLGL